MLYTWDVKDLDSRRLTNGPEVLWLM